ncbi:hypothetical protein ABPG75_010571 [Micractinium tetrahymenae]
MFGSPQRKGRLDSGTAGASAGSSGGLPDEVLLAIFAQLPLEQRQRALPLVCRRWRRLAGHPSLLEHLSATLGSASQPRALCLPRLRAFVRWLRRRAAAHAVAVRLALHVPDGVSRSGLRLALAELKEALAHSCPQLASLSLELNQQARAAGWLAQLQGLTSLRVASAERLRVAAQWQACTALRELALNGGPGRRLRITPDAVLPPCLTRLALAGERSEALPAQVAELSGLLSLSSTRARHTAAGLLPLSQLTTLESLAMEGCAALPPAAALAVLTSVKALQLRWCGPAATRQATTGQATSPGGSSLTCTSGSVGSGSPVGSGGATSDSASSSSSSSSGGSSETDSSGGQPTRCGSDSSADCEFALLQSALSSLTQLTLLRFASTQQHPAFPPGLAGLVRLQRFDWGGPTPVEPRLPPGPWLARLRAAILPADVAAASLAVLSAAWQLEELEAGGHATAGSAWPPHPEIVRWAARHPPLQRLVLSRPPATTGRGESPGCGPSRSSSTAGSPDDSPSSAGILRSDSEVCSGSSSEGSLRQGNVSLEAALREARELRPALAVRCH